MSKEFLVDNSDYEYSLSKFVGKKIVDIVGYPSDPFGGTPVFKINRIVFEDGIEVWVEGEHDTPYIPSDATLNNMSEEILIRMSKQ